MNIDNLKQSLKHLHTSLATTAQVDPELNQLLQTLETDIDALLKRHEEVVSTQQAQLLKSTAPSTTTPSTTSDSEETDVRLQVQQPPIPEPLPIAPDAEVLVERAQEISARFAISHPHVEPALRELAQILAGIGI